MAYSTSLKTLEAMLPYLTDLAKDQESIWQVDEGEAQHWAYKFREALWIATQHKEIFPSLAKAHGDFRIEVLNQATVQARRKPKKHAILGRGITYTGGERAGPKLPLEGRQTATSIVECWFLAQPSNDSLLFPEAQLGHDDLVKLWKWSQANKLLFFEVDGTVTLQKTRRDLVDLAWHPSDIGLSLDSEGREEQEVVTYPMEGD